VYGGSRQPSKGPEWVKSRRSLPGRATSAIGGKSGLWWAGLGMSAHSQKEKFARMFISVGDRNAAMGRVIQVRPQGATSEALFRRRLTLQRGL
jgi:hypothetical protein